MRFLHDSAIISVLVNRGVGHCLGLALHDYAPAGCCMWAPEQQQLYEY
jgi:hypothetical protein